MKTNRMLLSCIVVAASLCSACSMELDEGNEALGYADAALLAPNGFELNGFQLNGFQLNGFQLNGFQLNGFQLNGFQLNGFQLNGTTLEGTVFSGTQTDGSTVSGQGFVGAEITASLPNGEPIVLKIAAIEASEQPEVNLYTVLYLQGSSWKSLCGYKDGAPIPSIPLTGRWDAGEGTETGGSHIDDPSAFTLACRGYILAECVEMGYAPWQTATECAPSSECHAVPLRPYHQACTRMMRADYCGDGAPHTEQGVCINVWDSIDVQAPADVAWPLEAEWTVHGASCVAHTRRTASNPKSAQMAKKYIRDHCPERMPEGAEDDCGGAGSTFSPSVGFDVPLETRVLLRNASPLHPLGGACTTIE